MMRVRIYWNEPTQKWFMVDINGHFVQEFCDCVNMNRQFRNLDKKEDNYYEVETRRLINERAESKDNQEIR